MAPLSCRVHRDGPVIRVAAGGRMSMAVAPRLRTTLLKCLAECPAAVIVDLSGLIVEERMALSVFRAVRRQTAEWPSVPLLLCGLDSRAVPPQDRRLWLSELTVYESLAAAQDAASRPELLDRRVQVTLPHTVDAPVQARGVLVAACCAWGLDHLVPTAEVVVSELVANTVRHTAGGGRLVIIRGDRHLHLVMRDTDRRLPVPVDEATWAPGSDGGRGLRLIQALSTSWGAQAAGDGKAVWATLSLASNA